MCSMSREDIDAGLSDWLDEPERAELRAEVERLIRESPELGLLRADWERLTELLRTSGQCPGGEVEWDRLRERILRTSVDQSASAAASPPREADDADGSAAVGR